MPLANRSQHPDSTDPSEVNGARISDIARWDGGVRDGSLGSLHADQGLRYREEQEKLEEMRRKVRENGPQPTKKRIRGQVDMPDRRKAAVKWSAEEIGRLVTLFQKHLGQWAVMKRADEQSSSPKLTIRTSVDLKDKMRTLKKWLLRYFPARLDEVENRAKQGTGTVSIFPRIWLGSNSRIMISK
jgi:hypothetical protein